MWIDDIPRLVPEDYQKLQERWFEHFAGTDGVLAFGSFGSIGAPGLSDLDLVAVMEDEALAGGTLRLLNLDSRESQIMVHPPLVIPRRLYSALPLYHPVTIRWRYGGEAFPELTTEPSVGLLHVLEKTLYVQGRLLRAGSGDHSLRRLFLMLTSLARSVEWTERSGVVPTTEESAYATAILRLRADWLADPADRHDLERDLDSLLVQARLLAVTLPERLAVELMSGPPREFPKIRALQMRPRQFVRNVTGDLAAAVADYPPPPTGWRGRLAGEWRLAGPALFQILLARCSLEHAHGAVAWPSRVPSATTGAALTSLPDATQQALTSYTRANVDFAMTLEGAGLSVANFGTIWSATGWRRTVHRVLASLPGWT